MKDLENEIELKLKDARYMTNLVEDFGLQGLDLEERFEDMLEEIYGEINICGRVFNAANAFKKADRVSYEEDLRSFINNKIDEGVLIDIDDYCYEKSRVLALIEEDIIDNRIEKGILIEIGDYYYEKSKVLALIEEEIKENV